MSQEAKGTERLDEAGKIISSATGWSAAAGVIPLPFVDLMALAVVQGKMIVDLSELYGESPRNEVARGLVSVLLGSLLPAELTGLVLGSNVKAVPVVGGIVGAATMAGFSGAATYAIGKLFVRHFENGGTLASFSPEAIASDLKAEFSKAAVKA